MANEDELGRRAAFVPLGGPPSEEIAQDLGVSMVELERLLAEQWSQANRSNAERQAGTPEPEPRRSEIERRQDAIQLLRDLDFVGVEAADDPDWPGSADATIWFSDVASHDLSDLVDETVVWLGAKTGIREVVREDRELILVWGELDAERLEADLTTWWTERLAQIVNR